ncbi:hypothetical protein ACG873_21805 [Mesorhizobium sp. AaZ16]|uniref:hypothetical protein n=1 Tax=Mesorhizobium sp. AaZ16 TaxID=3402289 RepID=UPI00374F81C2
MAPRRRCEYRGGVCSLEGLELTLLIPPNWNAPHLDVGKPPYADPLALSGGQTFEADAHPFALAALLTAHLDCSCRHIAGQPLQIGRRVPSLDVAMRTLDANQLASAVPFLKCPGAWSLRWRLFRHENELGTYALRRQGVLCQKFPPSRKIVMTEPHPAPDGEAVPDLERAADEAVALCGGDAVIALLAANGFLEHELELTRAAVSFGYSRGWHRNRQVPDLKTKG